VVDVGEPKALDQYVSAEEKRWRQVIRDAKIEPLN